MHLSGKCRSMMCRDGRLTPLIFSLFPVHCISQNDHRSNTLKNCSIMGHQGCIIIDHWILLSTQNSKSTLVLWYSHFNFSEKYCGATTILSMRPSRGFQDRPRTWWVKWRMKFGQIKSFPGALSLYLYIVATYFHNL